MTNAPGERLFWFRPGRHTVTADRICDQCRRENGGRLLGNPEVSTAHFPDGASTLTVLGIDADPWWADYMRVHRDWKGPVTESALLDVIDPLRPME